MRTTTARLFPGASCNPANHLIGCQGIAEIDEHSLETLTGHFLDCRLAIRAGDNLNLPGR